mgnify:CR=1 FL=1
MTWTRGHRARKRGSPCFCTCVCLYSRALRRIAHTVRKSWIRTRVHSRLVLPDSSVTSRRHQSRGRALRGVGRGLWLQGACPPGHWRPCVTGPLPLRVGVRPRSHRRRRVAHGRVVGVTAVRGGFLVEARHVILTDDWCGAGGSIFCECYDTQMQSQRGHVVSSTKVPHLTGVYGHMSPVHKLPNHSATQPPRQQSTQLSATLCSHRPA